MEDSTASKPPQRMTQYVPVVVSDAGGEVELDYDPEGATFNMRIQITCRPNGYTDSVVLRSDADCTGIKFRIPDGTVSANIQDTSGQSQDLAVEFA